MGAISNIIQTNSNTWKKLLGDEDEFTMENRMFNLGCIITFIVLILFILVNGVVGLWQSFWLTVGIFVVLSVLYYYSRVKKKYLAGIITGAIASYIVIVINYYINS